MWEELAWFLSTSAQDYEYIFENWTYPQAFHASLMKRQTTIYMEAYIKSLAKSNG